MVCRRQHPSSPSHDLDITARSACIHLYKVVNLGGWGGRGRTAMVMIDLGGGGAGHMSCVSHYAILPSLAHPRECVIIFSPQLLNPWHRWPSHALHGTPSSCPLLSLISWLAS
jgi:hypothetical protein